MKRLVHGRKVSAPETRNDKPRKLSHVRKFNKLQLSKEELLAFWDKVRERSDFKVRTGEKVEEIKKEPDGIFTIVTTKGQHRSHTVILGLGKAGIP